MIEAFYQVLLQGRKPHPYLPAASQQQTFGSRDYGGGGIIKLELFRLSAPARHQSRIYTLFYEANQWKGRCNHE
jgi:hypothetical protein